MGGKKSTVWTRARSSRSRNTPASENLSNPSRRSGCAIGGRAWRAWTRSSGESFEAQPAQVAYFVRRTSLDMVWRMIPRLRPSRLHARAAGSAWSSSAFSAAPPRAPAGCLPLRREDAGGPALIGGDRLEGRQESLLLAGEDGAEIQEEGVAAHAGEDWRLGATERCGQGPRSLAGGVHGRRPGRQVLRGERAA